MGIYKFLLLSPQYSDASQEQSLLHSKHSPKNVSEPNRPSEEWGVEGAFESDIQLTPLQARVLNADIVLTESGQFRSKRKALSNAESLWPSGVIPYQFEQNFPWQHEVLEALKHWEKETCITFRDVSTSVQSELGHTSIVQFAHGPGCSSTIGRSSDGGIQETFLGDSCNSVGSAEHEIGHVIGFFHEQSRPDRDEHVHIHRDNVARGRLMEFRKYDTNRIRTDEPYDIGSVMHYGPTWFSKDGKAHTIDPRDTRMMPWMGQRKELSFMDVKTANKLYNCGSKCSPGLMCENGGYVGPQCTCVCPKQLTGRTCSQTVHENMDCGGVLDEPTGTITSPGYPDKYSNKAACNWMIQAGQGKAITLVFRAFSVEKGSECEYDSLEVKVYGPGLAGPKLCGEHQQPEPIVYQGSNLVIRFTSDESYNVSGFSIDYHIQ
ncbi:Protein SpAN [Mizuhopecten yessoensis]|uniref:Metalloendopeptidase n=1 Tax=Mizuhopecten yessoensis TaxID=6573 RepID=A0A210QX07_MIZYE|nr:Protein SpAN [Mizuhopecten yessoensis]